MEQLPLLMQKWLIEQLPLLMQKWLLHRWCWQVHSSFFVVVVFSYGLKSRDLDIRSFSFLSVGSGDCLRLR